MNNFLIIANKQKDINLEITEQIKHHITRMGAVCNVYDQYNRNVTSIDIPEGTQCILVIGGDGTILAAARMLVGNTIPLLGINLGTLGFLADVNLADLSKTLDLLLKDQYQVENRIMLTAEVYKQGEKAATYIALNDFNINRCGASRVIGLLMAQQLTATGQMVLLFVHQLVLPAITCLLVARLLIQLVRTL